MNAEKYSKKRTNKYLQLYLRSFSRCYIYTLSALLLGYVTRPEPYDISSLREFA